MSVSSASLRMSVRHFCICLHRASLCQCLCQAAVCMSSAMQISVRLCKTACLFLSVWAAQSCLQPTADFADINRHYFVKHCKVLECHRVKDACLNTSNFIICLWSLCLSSCLCFVFAHLKILLLYPNPPPLSPPSVSQSHSTLVDL